MDYHDEFYVVMESLFDFLRSKNIVVAKEIENKNSIRIILKIYSNLSFYVILNNNTIFIQLNKYQHYLIYKGETSYFNKKSYISDTDYLTSKYEILDYIFSDMLRHYNYITDDKNISYDEYMLGNKLFTSNFVGDIKYIVRNKKLQEMNKFFKNGY